MCRHGAGAGSGDTRHGTVTVRRSPARRTTAVIVTGPARVELRGAEVASRLDLLQRDVWSPRTRRSFSATPSIGAGGGRRELAASTVKPLAPGRLGVAETDTTRSATVASDACGSAAGTAGAGARGGAVSASRPAAASRAAPTAASTRMSRRDGAPHRLARERDGRAGPGGARAAMPSWRGRGRPLRQGARSSAAACGRTRWSAARRAQGLDARRRTAQ